MRKKEALLLTSILVLLMSGVIASAAADVAYIYRKEAKIDDNFVQEFEDAGLSVEFVHENSLPLNQNDFQMIFVGDEIFRREHLIPVNSMPTIIANYYHAQEWGLTDHEGVSQLASSSPLSVVSNGQTIQVYTQAREGISGPSIDYYYLDIENRAPAMMTVALTETTSSGNDFGDVISYASPGDLMMNGQVQQGKLCFFGIIETDFWTNAAGQLFDNCLSHVVASCANDNDCPDPSYTGAPFCQGGDVYQNQLVYSCQNGNVNAQCVGTETDVLVEQCSFGCSNGACVVPSCTQDSDCGVDGFVGQEFCSEDDDVAQNFREYTCNNPGTSESFCSSELIETEIEQCDDDCASGECVDIECSFDIECDDNNPLTLDECINPGTVASMCRNTPVNCNNNNDCGFTGFVGQEFCSEDDVSKNFQTATCVNPGTTNSFCDIEVGPQPTSVCDFACTDATCIRCDENLDCDDGNPSTTDSCVNPGTVDSYCSNGQVACSSESDCGVDGFTGAAFCSTEGNSVREFIDYTCNNAGTPASFCSSQTTQELVEECTNDQMCSEGSCVNVEIECNTDSDCGTDGFIGSPFCSEGNSVGNFKEFTCNNAGTAQSFCSSSTNEQIIAECTEGCASGQCIDVECTLDSQCDDSNPLTFDQCINPGTVASECRNTEINCANDLDCGSDGFVGSEFCSVDDNVVKNFQNSTCVNPGTLNSFCTTDVNEQVVSMCDFACTDGTCVRCDTNLDCDDGDAGTLDLCLEAGTPASYCTNEPENPEIECNTNLDCGEDTVIIPQYCSENNVNSLVMTWTCNNAGTPLSYCSSDVEAEEVEQCNEFCSNGECVDIECFNNLDCDDGNGTTVDICNNAGTPASYCTNTPENIACFTDTDCGIDGPISSNICFGSEVTQLNLDFKCNNAGTTAAFCSSTLTQDTVEFCDFACSGGMCIDEPAQCGNGVVEAGEQCDDGNLLNGDGCSVLCETEQITECTPGSSRQCGSTDIGLCRFGVENCNAQGEWSGVCVGEVTPVAEICDGLDNDCDGSSDEGDVCVVTPVCGNGIVEAGEQCDDGNTANGDGCSSSCQVEVVNPVCGNGVVEAGEQCDDGNTANGDGCSSTCEVEIITECTPGSSRQCGSTDVGQCSFGVENCNAQGEWSGVCVGEVTPVAEICDGLDNDCDGSSDEGGVCQPPVTECNDGIDNDGDNWIDLDDPSCSSPEDDSEDPFDFPQCDDGLDNDGDGLFDFPADPDCDSRIDNNEAA